MSEVPTTIPAVLERAAALWPDAEALVDGEQRWTFAELAAAADVAARAFIASGVQAGDRVSIWAPNISEWLIAEQGLHRAGAVLVPLNTRFKGNEAAYVMSKAGSRLLFTVTDFLDVDYVQLLREAEGATDQLDEIIVLRGAVPEGCVGWDEFLARAEGVSAEESATRAAAISPDDTADILFTSGTTGKPKGAMLSQGAGVRAYDAWSTVVGLRAGDRYLVINPFFHAFGLKAGILASLIKGATIVPQAVFDVPAAMARVVEERITMLPGPPAIFQTILNHPDLASFDLSSLRLSVTGAASIPVELIVRMREELAFETVVTGYGLTESTGIVTMCRHDDDPETIARTAGRPIPGVEIALVDDDGKEVAGGEEGEVLVRGYNIMKGYFEDAAATAEAIDRDGWLHTGDVAVLDANGNLTITDRKKDMFIVGGFNAYPAEIEQMIAEHPSVAAVAVVGIPDERLGEVGAAFVIPRVGTTVDTDELVAWCRERMANYKVPRRVEVVDALPLNASGKVLKFELQARLAG